MGTNACMFFFIADHVIVYDGTVMFSHYIIDKNKRVAKGFRAMMPKWADAIKNNSLYNLLTWCEKALQRLKEVWLPSRINIQQVSGPISYFATSR